MARKKRTEKSAAAGTLRDRAEELLQTRAKDVPTLPTRDVQTLLHELNMHQVELDLQNEELRRSQAELAEARDRYADLYDFAPVGYVILDKGGKILDANLTAAAMLGVDRRELIEKNILQYMSRTSQKDFHQFCRDANRTGIKRCCEIDMRNAAGSILTVRLESIAFESGGRFCQRVALVDITEKKQVEDALLLLNENLEQQAHTDELTGLPNRNFFLTVYKQKFDHIKRHFRHLALFMLDLNNFKRINDELGHAEGDHVLRLMAGRLQKACRSGDFLARIGGDEFVLLVEDYRDTHDLARIAEKIDACINIPVKRAGRRYRINASIGIARFDDTHISMDSLFKSADDAMYSAKRSGRLYCIAGMPCLEPA